MTRAPTEEDLLLAYLADRDVRCPGCRYSLLGVTGATCPECGTALELTLRTRRRGVWAFVVGLIPPTLGVGLGALLLLFLVVNDVAPFRSWGREEYVLLVYGSAHLTALAVWLSLRRRIDAMRPAPA